MTEKAAIRITLTREQQLQLAAATGLVLSTLELDVDECGEDGIVPATIPEAVPAPPGEAALGPNAAERTSSGAADKLP